MLKKTISFISSLILLNLVILNFFGFSCFVAETSFASGSGSALNDSNPHVALPLNLHEISQLDLYEKDLSEGATAKAFLLKVYGGLSFLQYLQQSQKDMTSAHKYVCLAVQKMTPYAQALQNEGFDAVEAQFTSFQMDPNPCSEITKGTIGKVRDWCNQLLQFVKTSETRSSKGQQQSSDYKKPKTTLSGGDVLVQSRTFASNSTTISTPTGEISNVPHRPKFTATIQPGFVEPVEPIPIPVPSRRQQKRPLSLITSDETSSKRALTQIERTEPKATGEMEIENARVYVRKLWTMADSHMQIGEIDLVLSKLDPKDALRLLEQEEVMRKRHGSSDANSHLLSRITEYALRLGRVRDANHAFLSLSEYVDPERYHALNADLQRPKGHQTNISTSHRPARLDQAKLGLEMLTKEGQISKTLIKAVEQDLLASDPKQALALLNTFSNRNDLSPHFASGPIYLQLGECAFSLGMLNLAKQYFDLLPSKNFKNAKLALAKSYRFYSQRSDFVVGAFEDARKLRDAIQNLESGVDELKLRQIDELITVIHPDLLLEILKFRGTPSVQPQLELLAADYYSQCDPTKAQYYLDHIPMTPMGYEKTKYFTIRARLGLRAMKRDQTETTGEVEKALSELPRNVALDLLVAEDTHGISPDFKKYLRTMSAQYAFNPEPPKKSNLHMGRPNNRNPSSRRSHQSVHLSTRSPQIPSVLASDSTPIATVSSTASLSLCGPANLTDNLKIARSGLEVLSTGESITSFKIEQTQQALWALAPNQALELMESAVGKKNDLYDASPIQFRLAMVATTLGLFHLATQYLSQLPPEFIQQLPQSLFELVHFYSQPEISPTRAFAESLFLRNALKGLESGVTDEKISRLSLAAGSPQPHLIGQIMSLNWKPSIHPQMYLIMADVWSRESEEKARYYLDGISKNPAHFEKNLERLIRARLSLRAINHDGSAVTETQEADHALNDLSFETALGLLNSENMPGISVAYKNYLTRKLIHFSSLH